MNIDKRTILIIGDTSGFGVSVAALARSLPAEGGLISVS